MKDYTPLRKILASTKHVASETGKFIKENHEKGTFKKVGLSARDFGMAIGGGYGNPMALKPQGANLPGYKNPYEFLHPKKAVAATPKKVHHRHHRKQKVKIVYRYRKR